MTAPARRPRPAVAAAILLSAALPATFASASAQSPSFPGDVDPGLVGDWSCDGVQVYITRLGSIEVLGDGYRAGLIDSGDGTLAIAWDEGGRDDWAYALSGDTLSLTGFDGDAPVACTAQD
jgi:hypothetical protein